MFSADKCGQGDAGHASEQVTFEGMQWQSGVSLVTARTKGWSEGLDQSCDVITLMGVDDSGSHVLGGFWEQKT